MAEILIIPHAKFSNSSITLWNEFPEHKRKSGTSVNSLGNLENNRVKGYLSGSSVKKIRNYVNIWVDCLNAKKFISRKNNEWLSNKITFCTLTLPAKQFHSDLEIKRLLLNRFHIEMKRKESVNTFLMVCEKQKNGNIHFHILYNKFIDWRNIRKIWNNILDDTGYIDIYRNNQNEIHRDGFHYNEKLEKNWSYQNQLKAYEKGIATNWTDPNSIDIHSLRKIKNVANYITKYLTKGDENLLIDGRIWSCSSNFKDLKPANFVIDNDIDNVIYELLHDEKIEKFESDYCTIIKNISIREIKNKSPILYKKYLETQNMNYKLLNY